MGEGKDIMAGEPWDAPLAPYFDIAEIAWNHAGTQLAYSCKKLTGTEELWFVNNDYRGAYWDENPVARRSYANSPHRFVTRWDTPILIFAGINDYRIPYSQSLEAFTAARLRNIPARLVAFDDEGHQVFKPQNSIVWNREFFAWLNRYLR
ncbi:MAG: prolyl oligopeptidase family serine peptidase [Tannerella sp.]|nr:prolyl oligopeptidase family serine peptidase [Tannerella sp.]